jgi:hypothetical protein
MLLPLSVFFANCKTDGGGLGGYFPRKAEGWTLGFAHFQKGYREAPEAESRGGR